LPIQTTTQKNGKLQFLGVGDLRTRWHFSRQAIHRRRKYDLDFPNPYCTINNGRDLLFLKADIEAYEKVRTNLIKKGGWDFCQSEEKWNALSENEKKRKGKFFTLT
jgi:hypothetical protein